MLSTPCYKCENRNAECHSTCKDYIEYKKKSDEIRDTKFKKVQIQQAYYLARKDAILKAVKEKRRRRK